MADQTVPASYGSYLPPSDQGSIMLVRLKTPTSKGYQAWLVFFLHDQSGGSGSGSGPVATIPVYPNGKLAWLNIPVPGIQPDDYSGASGIEWDIQNIPNNTNNNKKYARYDRANFVAGTQEYVPDIRNSYVNIINGLYKDPPIEGLSAAKITPEVVAIVDTMLDEIQDGSKKMVGVDIAFQLFYGIINWSGFIRNAKDIGYPDTVSWLDVLLGNSNYDIVVKYTAYKYRSALQIELNKS